MAISIDNGFTFITPEEALNNVSMETLVAYMDDEVREQVHREIAPCTDIEFLRRYLELSDSDLIL